MKIIRNVIYISFLLFSPTSNSTEFNGEINCYQNGTLILNEQQRVRSFKPSEHLKLLTDISLGQVKEKHIQIYSSSLANVVCIIKESD